MEDIRGFFRKNVVGMILAAIMAMLGIVIDGIVISRYMGTQSMAAYGLVTPLINLVMMCSGILSTGTQVVCARHVGAGDNKAARRTFSMCMVITITISAVLMLILLLFRTEFCYMLGASGDAAGLLPLSSDYILGMLFSIPFVFLLLEFNGLLRLDGDPDRIIKAVVVMTVLDIVGDFVNALVIHGGMLGMGITTSISYLAAFLVMVPHFSRKKEIIFRFSLKGLKARDLWDIGLTGSSSAVGFGAGMLRSRVLNGLMLTSTLAVTATAALSVLNTVQNVTSSVMSGMGMTCSLIAGLVYGKKDPKLAEELVRVTAKYALIIAGILFVILFPFAPLITGIFSGSGSEEMTEIAAQGLRIYAAGIFLYAINAAFINYTQGMRHMAISNTFCFMENFVFIVLTATVMFGAFDVNAVWIAFPVAEVLTFIMMFIFAAVRKRGLPLKFSDYTFM